MIWWVEVTEWNATCFSTRVENPETMVCDCRSCDAPCVYVACISLKSVPSVDKGPINSWDRQPYMTKLRDGKTPSFDPLPREIIGNYIIANYGSDQGVDNDDGEYAPLYVAFHGALVSLSLF